MNFVNLTPHTIHVYNQSGEEVVISIPASGQLARVDEIKTAMPAIDNIPVYQIAYGDVTGLPEPQVDTVYLVSALVLTRSVGRNDVFSPTDMVRDGDGKVIGCKAFSATPAN